MRNFLLFLLNNVFFIVWLTFYWPMFVFPTTSFFYFNSALIMSLTIINQSFVQSFLSKIFFNCFLTYILKMFVCSIFIIFKYITLCVYWHWFVNFDLNSSSTFLDFSNSIAYLHMVFLTLGLCSIQVLPLYLWSIITWSVSLWLGHLDIYVSYVDKNFTHYLKVCCFTKLQEYHSIVVA